TGALRGGDSNSGGASMRHPVNAKVLAAAAHARVSPSRRSRYETRSTRQFSNKPGPLIAPPGASSPGGEGGFGRSAPPHFARVRRAAERTRAGLRPTASARKAEGQSSFTGHTAQAGLRAVHTRRP